MVDLSKIKKGDTVKFRNGQVLTVTEATVYEGRPEITIWIEWRGKEDCFTYEDSSGLYYKGYSNKLSNWDIVEHIPNQSAAVKPAQDEMSVRDQFAMSALNGLLVHGSDWRGNTPEELSEVSYALADAMMKNRKKNG